MQRIYNSKLVKLRYSPLAAFLVYWGLFVQDNGWAGCQERPAELVQLFRLELYLLDNRPRDLFGLFTLLEVCLAVIKRHHLTFSSALSLAKGGLLSLDSVVVGLEIHVPISIF